MIEILYRVLVKDGRETEFSELVEKTLMPEAKKFSGCKLFSLFQNRDKKREFIFYEKWDKEQSVLEYKQKLITLLGDPKPGEEFPEAMNNLIEEDEDLI